MKTEQVIINRPNWLGSEIGLVTKTFTLPANFANTVTENNRKIVKSGTLIRTPHLGLLFQEIDITDGDAIAPVMIRGSYIDSKLPESASLEADNMIAQGLYAIEEGEVTRPDFGGESGL